MARVKARAARSRGASDERVAHPGARGASLAGRIRVRGKIRIPTPRAPQRGRRLRHRVAPSGERFGGATVRVDDVAKTFGRTPALRGVSLTVCAHEWVTITGPSGSGKSTLLNLIGSLEVPDRGQVLVDGQPVPAPRQAVHFRRHVVGFVFQDNFLLPYLSAHGNVEAALLPLGMRFHERHRRSLELLDEVGLAHRADHLPSELSGGERQGVSLARALAHDPRLLLADEPTGALDSASGQRALDLLATIRDRRGMTVIVVSHDPAVARRADRVVHLVDGRVAPDSPL